MYNWIYAPHFLSSRHDVRNKSKQKKLLARFRHSVGRKDRFARRGDEGQTSSIHHWAAAAAGALLAGAKAAVADADGVRVDIPLLGIGLCALLRLLVVKVIVVVVVAVVAVIGSLAGPAGGAESLLHDPAVVPAQGPPHALEPFAPRATFADDGRERIPTRFDLDAVAPAELNAALAVETGVRRTTAPARHTDLQQKRVAKDHGAETERVRADGRQQDAGDGRVSEWAAGGEGVCGGAGGGGDDAAVGLDDGEELVVAVELEVGDVGGRPAVDDEFVEDFESFAFDEGVGLWRGGEGVGFDASCVFAAAGRCWAG